MSAPVPTGATEATLRVRSIDSGARASVWTADVSDLCPAAQPPELRGTCTALSYSGPAAAEIRLRWWIGADTSGTGQWNLSVTGAATADLIISGAQATEAELPAVSVPVGGTAIINAKVREHPGGAWSDTLTLTCTHRTVIGK